MPRKPNYRFERHERERVRAAKKAERAARKAERAKEPAAQGETQAPCEPGVVDAPEEN